MQPAPETALEEGDFCRPPPGLHPEDIARPLLDLPEHLHLKEGEAVIDWLLQRETKVKQCRQILGTTYLPRVQGELNPCFRWLLEHYFERMPDFLIILDRDYWLSSSLRLREILVYHELSHCIHKESKEGEPLFDENERPRWGLRGHDVEEFTAVIRRYGPWNPELEYFVQAAQTYARESRSERVTPAGAGGRAETD